MGLTVNYTPTKVVFGRGAEKKAGECLKEAGAKRVLVHYGSERIVKNGFLAGILKTLDDEGIFHIELGGVVPNPRLSLVREGIELCRTENLDFILAVGGGSVIDSSKAIGYGCVYSGDVWDFYARKAVPQGSLPVGCVLTMAAAGSEMSDSSVITNEDGNLKRGCNNNYSRLKFALENPELTMTLPPYQTACATVDIMMHTMERYFSPGVTLELTDNFTFALLRTVKDAGLKALAEPDNYDARANLMWASSVSHNGLLAMGNDTRGDWATHQSEHELSGMFDVAHGAGLAAIWPSWARYVRNTDLHRFALLGHNVFDIPLTGDDDADSLKCIEAFEEFYTQLGMPTRISGLGIDLTEAEIEEMAEKATFFGTRKLGGLRLLDKEDVMNIFRMAK